MDYIINFSEATNVDEFCKYINAAPVLLEEALLSENRNRFYKQHKIPKHGKKFKDKYRIVYQILDDNLLKAHKNFARRFGDFVYSKQYIHKAAFGYVKKIGTRENASVHSGASLLLRADISSFFPSISSEKLVEGFKKLGLDKQVIKTLIGFLTLDNSLPLGFPASPMLANIVCKELDLKISDLASKYGCEYTRYADDISISGNTQLPTKKELDEIICKENFRLCESKFRITKIGQAHYVTGLSISDTKPHAPKILKKNLRLQLYYCKKFGIIDHLKRTITTERTIQSGINKLHGMACYISHIESSKSQKEEKTTLLDKWRELLKRDGCTVSYMSFLMKKIDETE